MKKILVAILCVVIVFGLAACGGKTNDKDVVGIWTYDSIDVKSDLYSEEEIAQAKEMYDSFMGGLYFDFKDDGTGVTGYVMPEEYTEENQESPFTYKDGTITGNSDIGSESVKYQIKDGKMLITDGSDNDFNLILKKVNSLDEIEPSSLFTDLSQYLVDDTEMTEEAGD